MGDYAKRARYYNNLCLKRYRRKEPESSSLEFRGLTLEDFNRGRHPLERISAYEYCELPTSDIYMDGTLGGF